MSVCVTSSPAGIAGTMSISHMPRSVSGGASSIMQGLPHHLHNSLVQNNNNNNNTMFGGAGGGVGVGVASSGSGGIMSDISHRNNMDDPNPDMLLALLARNKALEGMFIIKFFLVYYIEKY